MTALKTQPTNADVRQYLMALDNPKRQADCLTLLPLFETLTGKPAVLWGEAIVGFGRYYYTNTQGKNFNWPITGFSPRKQNLVIYLMDGFDHHAALMQQLGTYKTGRSCLYLNRLADVNMAILQKLIAASVIEMGRRYRCD